MLGQARICEGSRPVDMRNKKLPSHWRSRNEDSTQEMPDEGNCRNGPCRRNGRDDARGAAEAPQQEEVQSE